MCWWGGDECERGCEASDEGARRTSEGSGWDPALKAALGPSTGGSDLGTRVKDLPTCGRLSIYRCVAWRVVVLVVAAT